VTEPKIETAAGRALLEHMTEDANGFVTLTSGRFSIKWVLDALANEIPLIEAEARAAAERDVAALREALTSFADEMTLATDPDGDCFLCGNGLDPTDHDDEDSDCLVSKARRILANLAAAEPKP
jgi:hypothetical protein